MSNPINSATSVLSVGGNYRGQAVLATPQNFVVGSNVLVSSILFPQPRQLVLSSLSSGGLATFSLPNNAGTADLSMYATLPTDVATVTQPAGSAAVYGLYPGNPGTVKYGSFTNSFNAVDCGYSNVGDIIINLAANAASVPFIYICTTAGNNYINWANAQTIVPGMQRGSSGNIYVATNSGTTATGSAPTGTTTYTGADGVSWSWVGAMSTGSTFHNVALTT